MQALKAALFDRPLVDDVDRVTSREGHPHWECTASMWSESIVNVSNVNNIFVFPCSEIYVNFTLVNNGDKANKLINENDDYIILSPLCAPKLL